MIRRKLMTEQNMKWWKKAVIYQIYPKSFQDSNGDGIGDLPGIVQRLDYLEDLGIDAVWLSPVYRSPQDDNGYDISDYQDIDPMFGTMADMEELIREAGKHHIRIIMDLVLNHTSDEHRWFREAKKSRENLYHDYYVWRDGEEGTPPNDMRASDNPAVRQEIYNMINWWIEKGVEGFRLDVIDQIAKEPDRKITANGLRLHEFIREMSRNVFQKGDLITVGEAWGANTENAKLYSNPDGSEFSMVFQFEHICLDQQEGKEKWDLAPLPFVKLKRVMERWQKELEGYGWNSLFWDNHDLPRIVSRWGNDREYRTESAKMLAVLLHGMQGTPYIYQGEELGMTNVRYSIDEYRDIEILNMYKERKAQGYPESEIMASIYARGRDNARTPMQWDDSVNAGFTSGTPWIKVNPNYTEINAEDERRDPDSVFTCYKTLVRLRKEYPVFVDGHFELLVPEDEDFFAYTRENDNEKLCVICNFYGEKAKFKADGERKGMELLYGNYKTDGENDLYQPYEARIYYKKK